MAAVKFNSKCSTCGTQVIKGTGDVRKGASGKWVVTCDSHKPAPRPARVPRWVSEQWVMQDDQGVRIVVSGDDVHDAKQDGFWIVGRA